VSNRIIINDGYGAAVIDMQVVRYEWEQREAKLKCTHARVYVDARKNTVTCRDCAAEVNAIWYLSHICDKWSEFERYRKQYETAKALYDERSRTKCQHCHEVKIACRGVPVAAPSIASVGRTQGVARACVS